MYIFMATHITKLHQTTELDVNLIGCGDHNSGTLVPNGFLHGGLCCRGGRIFGSGLLEMPLRFWADLACPLPRPRLNCSFQYIKPGFGELVGPRKQKKTDVSLRLKLDFGSIGMVRGQGSSWAMVGVAGGILVAQGVKADSAAVLVRPSQCIYTVAYEH